MCGEKITSINKGKMQYGEKKLITVKKKKARNHMKINGLGVGYGYKNLN